MAILETFPNKDLDAGNGININDYEISADIMSSSDMDDVVTPLPTPTASGQRPFSFSTQEQVIGQWIDGRPLYQRSLTGTFPPVPSGATKIRIQHEIPKGIEITGMFGIFKWEDLNPSGQYYGNYGWAPIPWSHTTMVQRSGYYYPESFVSCWTQYSASEDKNYFEMDTTGFDNKPYVATLQYVKPLT